MEEWCTMTHWTSGREVIFWDLGLGSNSGITNRNIIILVQTFDSFGPDLIRIRCNSGSMQDIHMKFISFESLWQELSIEPKNQARNWILKRLERHFSKNLSKNYFFKFLDSYWNFCQGFLGSMENSCYELSNDIIFKNMSWTDPELRRILYKSGPKLSKVSTKIIRNRITRDRNLEKTPKGQILDPQPQKVKNLPIFGAFGGLKLGFSLFF